MNEFALGKVAGFSLVAALLGVASGCAADSAGAGEGELASVASAISRTTYTDGSGDITIQVKTCDWVAATNRGDGIYRACAYCPIDEGWVRVGGGGEIEGEASNARFRANFPIQFSFPTVNAGECTGPAGPARENTAWVARTMGGTHRVRAYITQMQLRDHGGPVFLPQITEARDNVQDFATYPAQTTVALKQSERFDVDGEYLLVGGGEIVPDYSTNDPRGYLTESRGLETPERSWQVSARFDNPPHGPGGEAPPALKVWVVGIDPCPWPDGPGGGCFSTKVKEAVAAATSGYGTAALTVPYPWISASVGGWAEKQGTKSRFLDDLVPFNGGSAGVTVRSKNNGDGASSATHASVTALLRDSAANYNSIRFVSGTLFSRSSSSLRQDNVAGDTANSRWYLENVGSGQYRIRNGNPGTSGVCVYVGTGSVVSVGDCGTSNAYKWTMRDGDYRRDFRLSSVSSGRCLDSDGLPASSVVVTRPCNSTQTHQAVFLSAYNWPTF